MKRLYLTLAFVLCIVLCVFAFASCEKKKTAATTTAGKTECAHVWGDYVVDLEPSCSDPGIKSKYCSKCGAQDPASVTEIEQLPHTEGADYTVDTPANCSAVGWESKHCTVCGQIIASTARQIDKNPDVHDVESWVTVEPTLLAPEGSKTGTCKLCGKDIKEDLVFKPYVFASTMTSEDRAAFNTENGVNWLNHHNLKTGIYVSKNINEIKDKDAHYYPDESNGNQGNDLLVEVSYLWNSTMTNGGGYTGEPLTFANGDGFDVFNVGSTIKAKDNRTYKKDGVDTPYTYTYITPTPSQIAGNASLKTPSIGEYGWHRLGFRVHQTAEIVGTGDDKSVKYTYIATMYLDGTEILSFDLADWVVNYFTNTVTGLLYIAYIDDEGNLAYEDVAAGSHGGYTSSFALLIVEEFFNSTQTAAYVVLGDLSMTCGHDFVQNVEANNDPVAATFTLDDKGTEDTSDDLTCPAKIWYKAKSN